MMEYVYDSYTWTDELKVLTGDMLIVPGLEMFGHACFSRKLAVLLPHIHQTAEFLYIVSGSQKYCIGDKEYEIKGNQVFVVDEDVVHSSGPNPYGRYENLWFRLDVETYAAHMGVPGHIRSLICERLHRMSYPIISFQDNQYSTLRSAFYHLASADHAEQMLGYSEFTEFVARMIWCTDPAGTVSPEIQKAVDYIHENVCVRMELEDLARLAGLSLSGFKQKFRREMGITPREYINLKKIEKGKELLASGMPVTQTAFCLDFSSSSYFSVLFRKLEDMSPGEYAKRVRQTGLPKQDM